MYEQDPFTVALRDLDAGEQRRHWVLPAAWIETQLLGTEAKSDGTNGSVDLYLKKTQRQVLVKGTVRARVVMPCARTLDPVEIPLQAEILLLLKPAAKAAAASGSRAPSREQERPLTAEEAAEDEYEGEHLVLGPFIREHLLLELPLFPVRSDLPSEETAATGTAFDQATTAKPLDPRLAPLAALAGQLRSKN
jgi:uncharacterized protein